MNKDSLAVALRGVQGHFLDGSVRMVDLDLAQEKLCLTPAASLPDIDGSGLHLLPAWIDLEGQPGFPDGTAIAEEQAAAAANGVMAVLSPADFVSPCDSAAAMLRIRRQTRSPKGARVLPVAALTRHLAGQQPSDIGALVAAGAVAFGHLARPLHDLRTLLRCMELVANAGQLLLMRPQEHSLAAAGQVHRGVYGSRLGLPGIPESAETVALSALLELARESGVRLHCSGISCARSLTLLRQARAEGIAISADVSILQLFYRDRDIGLFDSRFKLLPPLRSEEDRLALREALKSGEIDAVSSFHRPLEQAAKRQPFAHSAAGAASWDLLPSLLARLLSEGVLDWHSLVERMAIAPRRILWGDAHALPDDWLLFDPAGDRALEGWYSSAHNSPMSASERGLGRVRASVRGGRLVFFDRPWFAGLRAH